MNTAKDPYICAQELEAKWNKVQHPDDLITSSQMHESTQSASRLGSEAHDNHDLITPCPKQSPTRTSEAQSAGMDSVTHQDAARGNQVRSCYGLITSLRTQVIELEILLKEYELKNQLLQRQLDQALEGSKI
uniref:AlNc14C408G11429 protein n=1 Tax=Albugo laibachii Nc14 TaxID=890382 RepID=F0WZ20_9STRA|nr:AlNc14C408G11429 [Albugo laibachii Nc14]|eukprot:CCA26735.1 AlNc14C408G11429 [Albugo laibachii Nc14]